MSRLRSVAIALLAFGLCFPCPLAATPPPPGIEVTELAHKLLKGPDKDGDIQVSLKVTVKNTTDTDERVEIWVRALDREGFEVFDAVLDGPVRAGQTRSLTDSRHMNEEIYKSIVKWEVED